MITTCTVCDARYQLDSEKVPTRVIKVRCPACKGVFQLDGTVRQAEEPQQDLVLEDAWNGMPSSASADVSARTQADRDPAPSAMVDSITVPDPAASMKMDSTPVPAAAAVAVEDEPTEQPTGRRRKSKEEMLARALVSDILVYNRELRDNALADGTLLESLGGEIKKSWELYKEKVTPEVANSTNHFREALNDILAEGQKIF